MGPLEFGYQGLPRDPETGLVYFRNRYYDPELGRFISADPKGYVDGPSEYAFEMDDPPNGSDPMGTTCDSDWCKSLASGAGYLVGLAYNGVQLAAAPLINTWQAGKNAVDSTQRTVAAYQKGGVAAAKQQTDREGEAAGQQAEESLLGMIPGVNTFRQASKIRETYEKEGPFAGGMQTATTTFSLGTDLAVVYGGVKTVQAKIAPAPPPAPPTPPALPDFVAGESGPAISVSQSRMRAGFDAAGFPSQPTKSPGMVHTLPDGTQVRTMEPAGQAPRRASVTNANDGPIDPHTGKPPQPPKGLTPAQQKKYVRDRTHLEQKP